MRTASDQASDADIRCIRLWNIGHGAVGAPAADPRASAAACSPALRSAPAPPPVESPPVFSPGIRWSAAHLKAKEAPCHTDTFPEAEVGCLQTDSQVGCDSNQCHVKCCWCHTHTTLDWTQNSKLCCGENTWTYRNVIHACCQNLSQVAAPLCAPLHLLAPAWALQLLYILSVVGPGSRAQCFQLHLKERTRRQPKTSLLSHLTQEGPISGGCVVCSNSAGRLSNPVNEPSAAYKLAEQVQQEMYAVSGSTPTAASLARAPGHAFR